jgi:hypothetical protein
MNGRLEGGKRLENSSSSARNVASATSTVSCPAIKVCVFVAVYLHLSYHVFRFLSSLPFSPQPTRQCLGPVISLLTNTVSPVRACLII